MASIGTVTTRNAVTNPRIPFNTEIPGGLSSGYRIIMRGYVPSKASQFAINLFNPNSDQVLHINPRFKTKEIVRNSNSGGWGVEEKEGHFGFETKKEFDLVILVDNAHYSVSLNNSHSFDYKHRMSFRDVKRLSIEGDVECRHLSFAGMGAGKGIEIYNPIVPNSFPLSGFIKQGSLVQVIGTLNENASGFSINLQSGPGSSPKNISFHFNPRWQEKNNPHQVNVVRNALINGTWGEEERANAPTFPISRGAKFEMLILNDVHEWKVAFDGKHFISFKHRISSDLVDYVSINGDVSVTSIKQY